MIRVIASHIGKQYHPKWIFKDVGLMIDQDTPLAITGKNGSGKSTLLQIIAGFVTPTTGQINWYTGKKKVPPEKLYLNMSMASPYIDLIEEFTLQEIIRFQKALKPTFPNLTEQQILELSGLTDNASKPIKQFSSGMKQRVKLLLAMTSDTNLILLDEPCSNLDTDGISWYQQMLDKFSSHRTVVVASNNKSEEYPNFTHFIEL